MKVPGSLRRLYESQLSNAQRLKTEVDRLLMSKRRHRWHYESRIKELESFAQKIESGRVADPRAVEDMFGCTLVVRNASELSDAEELARAHFDLHERRPRDDRFTHKQPDSFPFDDLRLYLRWKDDPRSPPTGLDGHLFEMQVKTFLQHAWAIATHDLVYKSQRPEWGLERIAYQVKALLEHAELSIQQASQLAVCGSMNKSSPTSKRIGEFVGIVESVWDGADLPMDRRRLAQNVSDLCQSVGVKAGELLDILKSETEQGRGAAIRNLSPYGVVIASLLKTRQGAMSDYFQREASAVRRAFRVVVPAEVELPSTEDVGKWKNAERIE